MTRRNRREHFDSLVAEYVSKIGADAPVNIRIDRSSKEKAEIDAAVEALDHAHALAIVDNLM